MTLTADQQQNFARAKTSILPLWTVELRHPTFVQPLRLVNFKDDFTATLEANAPEDASTDVTFAAMAMRLTEPEIDTEADSTISIQVDGVSGAVQPYIAAANKTVYPMDATVRVYQYDLATGSAVDGAIEIIHLQIRHIAVSGTSVSLTLGYTNTANRAFPSQNYTPETNPGLV